MNAIQFKRMMMAELAPLYAEKEAGNLLDLLLEWATGLGKPIIFSDPQRMLTESELASLETGISQLKQYRPIQYIVGRTWFYDLELEVNENVLIPRPETEELVHWIIKDCQYKRGLRILDAGTGSGCIAIALAKYLPGAEISAFDLSHGALAVAGRNALRHSVDIDFFLADIFDFHHWKPQQEYDVIVSNPPYVKESEKSLMMPNVLDHEPSSALFVADEDPLRYYRAIVSLAEDKLCPGGSIYVEINESLGEATLDLFPGEVYKDKILKQDINGKNRMIRACR